jgi:hypothetical protein
MKTIWVLTSAAVAALGLLSSQAAAQDFAPGNRPPVFGPNPQAPRPDDKKDRQHLGSTMSWLHALPHGHSGAVPQGLPEKPFINPIPPAVAGESFAPHVPNFKVPNSLPEISASRFSLLREFRSGSGGAVAGAGGIAGLLGALFGRKKKADS